MIFSLALNFFLDDNIRITLLLKRKRKETKVDDKNSSKKKTDHKTLVLCQEMSEKITFRSLYKKTD